MEELFNKWLESKDTTENVINHLKGQKPFHLDFLKYVTEQCDIHVVRDSYYWVKLMTDDKHEPAMAINLLGVMNFQFFNGVSVPCKQVNDYSECNYR
tara:strand:+ start:51 stop:341 length:291 start_codon:yes stop_codon:yes gene_type:complete